MRAQDLTRIVNDAGISVLSSAFCSGASVTRAFPGEQRPAAADAASVEGTPVGLLAVAIIGGTLPSRTSLCLDAQRRIEQLAAGRPEVALELLKTIARQTSECGMIPEQVWDADDIPEHSLFNGHPTGSGMPLAWAHAEYIRLLCSLHEGFTVSTMRGSSGARSPIRTSESAPGLMMSTALRLFGPERTFGVRMRRCPISRASMRRGGAMRR
jgi:hypothetical protein